MLKRETAGYRVIAVGSSAGGYAAILYGSLLNAEKVFAFNPQWEVKSLLESSDEKKNPIIFRESCNPDIRRYYDIVPFLNETPIYYFISENSPWDAQQRDHIGIRCGVNIISFKSAHHGIPFPRVALSSLLTMSDEKLHDFVGKKYYPIIFSIKIIGLWKTITNTASQLISMLRKKYEKC